VCKGLRVLKELKVQPKDSQVIKDPRDPKVLKGLRELLKVHKVYRVLRDS
jgi:hypothetical protein